MQTIREFNVKAKVNALFWNYSKNTLLNFTNVTSTIPRKTGLDVLKAISLPD